MPLSILEDSLFGFSHRQGENTALCFEGGALEGVAGWVRGENGEFFGSPVFCASEGAARALVARVLEEAKGAQWVRVSAFPEESFKRAALEGRGFRPLFEFVEFETAPRPGPAPSVPVGLREFPLREAGVAEFRELMNASFAGVDNSLPLSESDASEVLTSGDNDPALSLGWRDAAGRLLAFIVVDKFGYVDSIGVSPAAQGKGYGSLLYSRVLTLAAGKERLFTTVSSRNAGSLALHKRLGIPEVERRVVFQKELHG